MCHLGRGGDADGTAEGVEYFAVVFVVFFDEGRVFEASELTEAADCLIGEFGGDGFVGIFGDDEHHMDLFLVGVNGEFRAHDFGVFGFVVEFFGHLRTNAGVVERKIRRLFFFGAEAEVECGECDDDEEGDDEFAFQ